MHWCTDDFNMPDIPNTYTATQNEVIIKLHWCKRHGSGSCATEKTTTFKSPFEQKEAFSKITYEYSNSLGFNKKIVN